VSAEVVLLREAATPMPEPPDGAMVVLVDPSRVHVPGLFERHDDVITEPHDDHWYDSRGDAWVWSDIMEYARTSGRELHRVYLRDDLPLSVAEALDVAERAGVVR
jgi:hypothetical protein